jgi:hypothetical protein
LLGHFGPQLRRFVLAHYHQGEARRTAINVAKLPGLLRREDFGRQAQQLAGSGVVGHLSIHRLALERRSALAADWRILLPLLARLPPDHRSSRITGLLANVLGFAQGLRPGCAVVGPEFQCQVI